MWNRHPEGGLSGLGMSPLQDDPLAAVLLVGIGNRDRRKQRLGVGVRRMRVDPLGGPDLHDPPEVHDRDAVADVAHDRKVMGDEEAGQPEPLL